MMLALYILTTLAALILAAAVSPGRGRKLWLALIALCWGIGQFNTLLEAVVFSVMPASAMAIQLLVSLIPIALLATIAVAVTGKWRGPGPENARPNLAFVQHFYADKPLPAATLIAALQVPRSLVFVLSALLWLRTGPRHASLVLGVAFALIGGIAPMFPDNPYMPADIRLAHGVETGTSNFLFGLLTGWLLRPGKAG